MESGTIPLQNTIAVTKTFNFDGLTPDTYGWKNATIDFSTNVPEESVLIAASLRTGTTNKIDYFMPYINPQNGEIQTFIHSYVNSSRKVNVRDKVGGWGNIDITAIFKLP